MTLKFRRTAFFPLYEAENNSMRTIETPRRLWNQTILGLTFLELVVHSLTAQLQSEEKPVSRIPYGSNINHRPGPAKVPDSRRMRLPPVPLEWRQYPDSVPLRVLGPGLFAVGEVRLDKRNRTVSFPAILNLAQGPVEYFLVSNYGKVHESVLRTEAAPFHIHTAMLLLDAASAGSSQLLVSGGQDETTAPPTISDPASEIIPGDPVAVEVSWVVDGVMTTRRAEELVLNLKENAVMAQGNWVYNGSQILGTRFVAQVEGSVVSLITDRHALANNMGPGRDNDDIWAVNTNNLPPAEARLEVTLRLSRSGEP